MLLRKKKKSHYHFVLYNICLWAEKTRSSATELTLYGVTDSQLFQATAVSHYSPSNEAAEIMLFEEATNRRVNMQISFNR